MPRMYGINNKIQGLVQNWSVKYYKIFWVDTAFFVTLLPWLPMNFFSFSRIKVEQFLVSIESLHVVKFEIKMLLVLCVCVWGGGGYGFMFLCVCLFFFSSNFWNKSQLRGWNLVSKEDVMCQCVNVGCPHTKNTPSYM